MKNLNEVITLAAEGAKNEMLASLPQGFPQDKIDRTMAVVDSVVKTMIEKSEAIKYGCEDEKSAITLASMEAFKYQQREKAIAFKIISYVT